MVFTPIIGTLIYLLDRDSNSVLLINRDSRPDDDHYGKFNGLGGKLEVDESVAAGALRELQEEAGVAAKSLLLRGTISWSNFGPNMEPTWRYLGPLGHKRWHWMGWWGYAKH